MVLPLIGAAIGGISSIIGGSMAARSQREANEANERVAERNIELQREFAQSGVQWRMEDAKKAGVHPLFAMGAQTQSFSPVHVGHQPVTGMADGLAAAGQDIGRAVGATQSRSQKAYNATLQTLQLQRAGLENELLSAQIRRINHQAGSSPGIPAGVNRYLIDGQGDTALPSDLIEENPLKRTVSAPGQPQSEPGAIPDVGYARTSTGWAPVPSQDVKERIEDQIIPELLWAVRNNLLPSFAINHSPPPFPPPPGKHWDFNPYKQEYQLFDTFDRRRSYSDYDYVSP